MDSYRLLGMRKRPRGTRADYLLRIRKLREAWDRGDRNLPPQMVQAEQKPKKTYNDFISTQLWGCSTEASALDPVVVDKERIAALEELGKTSKTASREHGWTSCLAPTRDTYFKSLLIKDRGDNP